MKKLFTTAFLLSLTSLFAQVGINTNTPKQYTLLDVDSTDKGILIPRVALTNIFDRSTLTNVDNSSISNYENSLLLYNTNTSNILGVNEYTNVTPGYYYWETDRWVRMTSTKDQQFFYMPSIIIPTSADQVNPGNTFGTIDLYSIYKSQFTNAMVKNPTASTTLPIYKVNQLDYYITWYDESVFTNVRVSNNGVLTYQIKENADVFIGSFMNIIFAVK
ncbi:hypothetical protein [Faecalibacter macacae]|uniref:Uncharacterized protein n=1 Tax=Faecalibacter macacae TaxID=1859289 RepID=A0A3L9MAY3_9FLAO|nr:hypothetical protein [Faecalibacter macacae]RLZ09733.1 hypothetical protein EAH69_08065 [Faecalibacter macacae]